MRLLVTSLILISLSACSMDQMLVRASMPMIEGGIYALNQENDLQLAEAAMPANIELLEGMISMDPENITLHTYAAQAYYGLAYGFNEDTNPARASRFYVRGMKHGFIALRLLGIDNTETLSQDKLELALQKIDEDDVAVIFWTASNWAKWVDMNRDKPRGIMALPKATALMQRTLELDETFYYGSAHMFFGVYYGARAPMFGGDFKKSEMHFNKARKINDDELLIVDMLQAKYLERQRFDRDKFNSLLNKVIKAPDDLNPDFNLMNQIAKRKARALLGRESSWF
jgi:hypothetical protein